MALREIAPALALAAGLGLAGAAPGCAGRNGEAEEPIALVVDAPPPPPRGETVALRRGFIWVRGSWEMRGGRWRWRGGRFERERAGQVWIAGYWQLRGDRYHWVAGRWRASTSRGR